MGWSAGRFHWNVQFRRPPQDWEEEAFDRFMGLVYSSTVQGFGPDKKSIGTSLEGFEEQITGLLLALEERRKKRMLEVASQRKMAKAGHKGHRELKNLLNSWGEENEAERSGVLLMWDNRIVEKLEEAVGHFSVSCRFKNVVDQFVWAFSGVYGPNCDRDRCLLWEELLGVCSWWEVPWCVGGDFNVVRFPSERFGSANFTSAMHRFSAFILELSLIDLPLVGGNFTWSNSREVVSSSRLDRFLLSADWEEKFPSGCQCRLSRLLSDHFPIILEGGNLLGGKKPFRFENMLLKDEGFLERDLNVLEVIEKDRMLSAEESLEKDQICGELEKSTLLEEICGRQLYSENEVHKPFLDEVVFSSISEGYANWLDRPFDEDEVFRVVHDFSGDKVPGPDGFSIAFFQSCWSLVKTDIMNVFHNFHAHAVFEKSLNATFLALIPKKYDAVDVKDFQPISLVGGLYKIIAKVLAN
ncbi:uncharacterized protein LOC136067974 [Quercus suber]|uniref:uncharacterized protein LOC136067974 n=1 Tax=Quercus suber TaxID=58331 RepID=UPI0032DFD818